MEQTVTHEESNTPNKLNSHSSNHVMGSAYTPSDDQELHLRADEQLHLINNIDNYYKDNQYDDIS